MASENAKVELTCPSCSKRLRLPAGQSGNVKCPNCGNAFRADTRASTPWLAYVLPLLIGFAAAEIGALVGEYTHYQAAFALEQAKPRGDYDASAHLDALRDALRYGNRHGFWVAGLVAFLFSSATTKEGYVWRSIPIGLIAGIVAAAIVGYFRW